MAKGYVLVGGTPNMYRENSTSVTTSPAAQIRFTMSIYAQGPGPAQGLGGLGGLGGFDGRGSPGNGLGAGQEAGQEAGRDAGEGAGRGTTGPGTSDGVGGEAVSVGSMLVDPFTGEVLGFPTRNGTYAVRAVRYHPDGRRFDFTRSSARTPHAVYV